MPGNGIFVNYRRADASGHAGRLRDHLVARFGQDRVFMDVGILGGADWVATIERSLGASGALLAIIGPNWSSSRLQDPGDRLRQELEAAIALGVEIIPVLVGGARMPDEDDLPPSLRFLTSRQAVRLTEEGWEDDVRRLTGRLAQLVAPGRDHEVEPRHSPVAGLISALILLSIVAVAGIPDLPASHWQHHRSEPEDHAVAGFGTAGSDRDRRRDRVSCQHGHRDSSPGPGGGDRLRRKRQLHGHVPRSRNPVCGHPRRARCRRGILRHCTVHDRAKLNDVSEGKRHGSAKV